MPGAIVEADELRAQFNGLDDKITATNTRIDNIPANPQGPPGDVSQNQLNDAMSQAITSATMGAAANSSANSNAVATLNLTVSDPPTQAEMQVLANKLDELILALRR